MKSSCKGQNRNVMKVKIASDIDNCFIKEIAKIFEIFDILFFVFCL